MKISAFKELLLRKSEQNQELHNLIKYIKDDVLVGGVLEVLEKMARYSTQRASNGAVQHFGSDMNEDVHPNMIHDALSHHASQYKAALKNKNQDVANKHAAKIFDMMHMAYKLTDDGGHDHTGGKLSVSAPDPQPWERQHYTSTNDKGKFSTDTKGWGRHSKDYSWLQNSPHSSYSKEVDSHGHKGAYPLEEIKVNGKHLDIDNDAKYTGTYKPHEFDQHPILQHYNTPSKSFGEDQASKYHNDLDAYNSSEHMGSFLDRHDKMQQSNPDVYAKRGSIKSEPVHGEPTSKYIEPDKKVEESEPVKSSKSSKSKEKMDPKEFVANIDSMDIPDDLKARIKGLFNK